MREEVRAFVIESLQDMNYDVEGIDDDTTLGPAGLDVESLALADLTVRVEDRFGVRFADDESEELALMTVGEFTAEVAARTPDQVRERIDSMELAWLVHQVEQKYGVRLDDDQLDRMTTVTDAVTVLHETVARHG